jgi:hypothetical protein
MFVNASCFALRLESMPLKMLLTVLMLDALFIVLAIPLILKKVPRNCLYGFRVKATMENDFVWYETNAYFGRGFLMASIVSACLILGLYFFNLVEANDFMRASQAVLIVPPLLVVFLTFRFIRSLK